MNQSKSVWAGAVVIVVLAVLVMWWVMASRPLVSSTDVPPVAESGSGETAPTDVTAGSNVAITKVSRSSQNVTTIMKNLPSTSQFNALFNASGVASSISATGKYTIFVPTNGAFAQLAGGMISGMTSAEKLRLVKYHIISGTAVDVDAEVAGSMQALSGDYLNFSYGENKIPMVNSAITITEYTGKNGTVYLIDNVLLPPKKSGI
ncbi:fasciclin domain-containing protein [Candidatus Kaiserbacteria bacterium]|nr:fasciclin domain-containing protein [Candidatus Kaiserbacteria bacterium]